MLIPDNSEFFCDPEDPAGDPLVFIMSSLGDNSRPEQVRRHDALMLPESLPYDQWERIGAILQHIDS